MNKWNYERLSEGVQKHYEWAVNVRRELHKIPERGFQEVKTRTLIAEKLEEIGCEYRVHEGGWITALVKGELPGKVTGFRADIDALPVTEPEGCPFISEHPGYMHACGHDMHTAIMLGTARFLTEIKSEFAGSCCLMFEPAEETEGGAKPMTDAGIMEEAHVERVYGLHVMPRLAVGQVESRPGTLNASTDGVIITVKGTSSHGAYPENGNDAIVCACELVCALQTLVSRNVAPLETAVLTIGTINGGTASNIISGSVEMTGTLRTADPKLRAKLIGRMDDMAKGIGQAMGCEVKIEVEEGYSALVNVPEHSQRVLDIAADLFGRENALVKEAPSMGGEDFSYFLDHAPGAFFHVGCSPDAEHIGAPLHSEKFNPDERCMRIGIMMEAALALNE